MIFSREFGGTFINLVFRFPNMGQGFKIPFVLILVIAIFLFGCLGGGQTPGTTGQQRATGTQQPSGSGTPTATPPTTTGPGTADISAQAFGVLLAGNIPVHCTIQYQNSTPVEVYMKGMQNYRAEIRNDQSGDLENTCVKMAVLVKGDKTYIGCTEGSLFSGMNCDWLEIPKNASSASPVSGSTSQYDPEALAAMKDLKTSCGPWIYDESKFSPPAGAKTCTMESLISGITPPPN